MEDYIALQHKRVHDLVNETFNRLDAKEQEFLKNSILSIERKWDNRFFEHMVNGETIPLNKSNTEFKILLNVYRLRILSDDAVIGVISHEFAHVKDYFGKNLKIRKIFKKIKLLNTEKNADKIAKSWGFSKEINKMREETVAQIIRVVPPKDFKPNLTHDIIHLKFKLRCPDCKKEYEAEYFSSNLCNDSFINISDLGVPVGQIISDFRMNYIELMKNTKCLKCKKGNLEISLDKQ